MNGNLWWISSFSSSQCSKQQFPYYDYIIFLQHYYWTFANICSDFYLLYSTYSLLLSFSYTFFPLPHPFEDEETLHSRITEREKRWKIERAKHTKKLFSVASSGLFALFTLAKKVSLYVEIYLLIIFQIVILEILSPVANYFYKCIIQCKVTHFLLLILHSSPTQWFILGRRKRWENIFSSSL